MSDSWTTIDLSDKPVNVNEVEIELTEVDAEPAPSVETPEPERQPSQPAVSTEEAEDDDAVDSGEPVGTEPKKKLTRSQRLKLQRDEYARRLAEKAAEAERLRKQIEEYEARQAAATAAGYDFYAQTLETEAKVLRAEFDKAYAEGDPAKIWEVQEKMADLAARRAQLEAERRRAYPIQRGMEAQQQTPVMTSSAPQTTVKPNPLGVRFVNEHKDWFGKDVAMTAAARAFDLVMANEGWDPNDPEYYDELERRLREAFPHKFGAQQAKRPVQPTVQNRGSDIGTGQGKVRVAITQADRETAARLGISIEAYARQKAKMLAAQNNANGYTEIF